MAKGTLDDGLFKRYMLQDYLYLRDYIEILHKIRDISDNEEITAFLCRIIEETGQEAERVHLPILSSLGITSEEIAKSSKIPAISDYIEFMRSIPVEYGLTGGLTALLQCSWAYAFIGNEMLKEYPDEIAASKYRSWFEAYTCQNYQDANRMWIDMLDKHSTGIDEKTAEDMCRIFRQCAVYENELWDALYKL